MTPCNPISTYCNQANTDQCNPAPNVNFTCDLPTCGCKKGWTGQDCATDIDECQQTPSVCKHGGTCTNTPGSFYCTCRPGYGYKDCSKPESCRDAPQVCATNANCVDMTSDGYTYGQCQCPAGHPGDGYNHCDYTPVDQAEVRGCYDDPHCFMPGISNGFDYQGTCPVTLLRNLWSNPFLPDFKIVIKSKNFEGVTSKVSYIDKMYMRIYGHNITMHATKNPSQLVSIDGQYVSLPYNQLYPKLIINSVQNWNWCLSYTIQTWFGMSLLIEASHSLEDPTFRYVNFVHGNVYVRLPQNDIHLQGNIGGIAAAYKLPDGSDPADVDDFGDQWAAENLWEGYDSEGCIFGKDVKKDNAQDKEDIEWAASNTKCSLLTDGSGPFEKCFQNMVPEKVELAYKNCNYDVARYRHTTDDIIKNMTCKILSKFAADCFKVLQVKLNLTEWVWRPMAGCPSPQCGPHAVYYDFAPQCVATCRDPFAPYTCPTSEKVPRCMCETTLTEKYVNSDGVCILHSDCPKTTDNYVTVKARQHEVDLLCRSDCLWLGPNAKLDNLFCKPLKCGANSK